MAITELPGSVLFCFVLFAFARLRLWQKCWQVAGLKIGYKYTKEIYIYFFNLSSGLAHFLVSIHDKIQFENVWSHELGGAKNV